MVRKPKLEKFLPIIHEILRQDQRAPKKQRHTAQRIFERLRDEHRYDGGLTIVKDAVRGWKQRQAEVFVPLSHRSGDAQADFGERRASRRCPSEPLGRRRSVATSGEDRCRDLMRGPANYVLRLHQPVQRDGQAPIAPQAALSRLGLTVQTEADRGNERQAI